MAIKFTLSNAKDISSGALLATFCTYLYVVKEKFLPTDKKQRKMLKKKIDKNGLEVEVSASKTFHLLFTIYLIFKGLKEGNKHTILSSALFTTIALNLTLLKKVNK